MLTDSITKNDLFFFENYVTRTEELELKQFIKETLNITITGIEKLCDRHLYAAFKIKEKELGTNSKVIQLIHSTAACNVESIKKNNLDWRKVCRAKYGYGVAFTKNADYANYHSSFHGGAERAFIVSDVCVKNIKSVGDNKDISPSSGIAHYDTYLSGNGYVYVKFDDFTFYPKYVLYYNQPDRSTSSFYRRRRWYL